MKFRMFGRSAAEMPFLDHLEELRWRILWSLLALVIGTIAGLLVVLKLPVLAWLMEPIRPYLAAGKLVYLGPADGFIITLQLGLTIGIILAAPIVIYQVWAFLSPALYPGEKRAIVPALYLGLVLFVAGAALGYFLALPMTIQFLMGFQAETMVPQITASLYFSFVTKMLLAFGIIFELPVVVLVLSALGLITSGFLKSKRRYAVAGMAILAAMITPGDVITVTVLMMLPLVLLYELSIGLARLVERGRERRAAAELRDATPELPDATPEAT